MLKKQILIIGVLAINCAQGSSYKFELKPIVNIGPKESHIGFKLGIQDTAKKQPFIDLRVSTDPERSAAFRGAAALTIAGLLATGYCLKKTDGVYTIKHPAIGMGCMWAGFGATALIHDCARYVSSKDSDNRRSSTADFASGTIAGATGILVPAVDGVAGLVGCVITEAIIRKAIGQSLTDVSRSLPMAGMLAGTIYGSMVASKKLQIDINASKACGYGLLNVLTIGAAANTVVNITNRDLID